jgi:hypothetical protein
MESWENSPKQEILLTMREVKLKKYHTSNGIFVSEQFEDHVDVMEQESEFLGMGVHH